MKERIGILPNLITSVRIVGTLALLPIRPLSAGFYWVYTLTGLTDALDGLVARATHTASALGAKLDSAADLLFYAVMLIRILPELWRVLPGAIWFAVGFVLALRLTAYAVAAVKYRKFASLHTYGNKLTGLMVFAVPYFLLTAWAVPLCWAACCVGILSSGEELAIHLRSKEYRGGVKTIFTQKNAA